jgi:hypothetical protein
MNSSNIIGALLGGGAGYFLYRNDKDKWWWTVGGAVVGAVAAPLAMNALSDPSLLPASEVGITPLSTLPTVPSSSTTGQVRVITLAASRNVAVTGASPDTTFEVALPANATWSVALQATDSNSSIGSAPSGGSNPAAFTYVGGGSSLICTWVDPSGAVQNTTISISD